jgi:hypothetical protein
VESDVNKSPWIPVSSPHELITGAPGTAVSIITTNAEDATD